MKIVLNDQPHPLRPGSGPFQSAEAGAGFGSLLEIDPDEGAASSGSGDEAAAPADRRTSEELIPALALLAPVVPAPAQGPGPDMMGPSIAAKVAEAGSTPVSIGRIDRPALADGTIPSPGAAADQPAALPTAPTDTPPAALADIPTDGTPHRALTLALVGMAAPEPEAQPSGIARPAPPPPVPVAVPANEAIASLAAPPALTVARIPRAGPPGSAPTRHRDLPIGPTESPETRTGGDRGAWLETVLSPSPALALTDAPAQSGPEWSGPEGATDGGLGEQPVQGLAAPLDGLGDEAAPDVSGQRIQDVALAVTAADALDIRLMAVDEEARAEVAGQADRLLADLQLVGTKVEALRVETGRGSSADGSAGTAGGQQPGPGERGSAARQEDAGRLHRAGVNGAQGPLATAVSGGGGKVDRYA